MCRRISHAKCRGKDRRDNNTETDKQTARETDQTERDKTANSERDKIADSMREKDEVQAASRL